MNLFYAEPEKIRSNSITVERQEATHISKVLRKSEGDQISVTDGKGNEYDCKIIHVKKKRVFLEIISHKTHPGPDPIITLCMGIIKKRDRLEFAVEKSVELGVSKIVLFEGEHSIKGNVRIDRLKNTAISAMKQSLRFYLPEIVVEENLLDAVSTHAQDTEIVQADETTQESKYSNRGQPNEYFLIVGPEGGFSSHERNVLMNFDPQYYSLGSQRLRAETAAMVMVDRFANLK